ncbi:uncharacterized protein [Palaemon carinicauda]
MNSKEKSPGQEESSSSQSDECLKHEKSENSVNSRSGQDSGMCLVERPTQGQMHSSKEVKCSSYITSTPKKEVKFLEAQMILDDPMLSSIDEVENNMTDQDVDSLSDDESFENTTSTRLCKTHITALHNSGGNCTPTNKSSGKQTVCETKSFELKSKLQPDLLAVKRNLFDIPVSPKLKSRVRQRLYTLVNSIDGYVMREDIESNQKLSQRYEASTSLPDLGSISMSMKPMHRLCNHVCNRDNECSCKLVGEEANKRDDLSHFSHLNSDTSERYASAVSSVLDLQFQNLHLHQEQLSREKSNFMLQKGELDAQISFYKDKLLQMMHMAEEMEIRLENSERERLQQTEHFKKKIEQQNELHKERLSLLRLEYEKRAQENETAVATTRLEVTKACDMKIQEVIKSSRERTAAVENMYQTKISHLNTIIAKLQAERRLENLRDIVEDKNYESQLKADLECVTKEKDALKSEIDVLRDRLTASFDLDQKSQAQQKIISDLESKQRALLVEVSVWREEAKKLQQKASDLENQFKRDTQEILQESRKSEQRMMDEMKLKFDQEHNFHKKVTDTLKEELIKMSLENEKIKDSTSQMEKELQKCYMNQDLCKSWDQEIISLKTQLHESTSRLIQEKENHRQLRSSLTKELLKLKDQNKQEMMNYRLLMEKEKSIAVSRATLGHEEETMAHLRGVENCYQELFKTLQSHFKVQIDEYKKAVRILKLRMKKLEEEKV